ncbi:MAG: hypothetical protein ACLQJR_07605 [Stellaceae bacterium]
MRSLKLLVVVMGVLLVAGTAALIAAIIDRASHRAAAPPPRAVARGFDRAVIDLPAGARVLASEAADGRLVLRVGLAEGGEELILIDPASGALLGTIELRPAASGAAR